MGGKPSKGTQADKRLAANQGKTKAPSKPMKPKK